MHVEAVDTFNSTALIVTLIVFTVNVETVDTQWFELHCVSQYEVFELQHISN